MKGSSQSAKTKPSGADYVAQTINPIAKLHLTLEQNSENYYN